MKRIVRGRIPLPPSTLNEQRIAVRRVLQLVNRYLARQKADLLVTDGRGLMTWREIRSHVRAAIGSDVLRQRIPAKAQERAK